MFNVTEPGLRLIRWRFKLEKYDYGIIHCRQKAHEHGLSRCISTITSPEDTTNENTYEGNSDKMNEYNDADK